MALCGRFKTESFVRTINGYLKACLKVLIVGPMTVLVLMLVLILLLFVLLGLVLMLMLVLYLLTATVAITVSVPATAAGATFGQNILIFQCISRQQDS